MTQLDQEFEGTSMVYDKLLDISEELHREGVTTSQIARATALFLVELSFDCAPSGDYAMHLILSAIIERLERNIDDE